MIYEVRFETVEPQRRAKLRTQYSITPTLQLVAGARPRSIKSSISRGKESRT
jgi:hypothetical protein